MEELYKSSVMLEAKLLDIPQLQDVTSDLQIKNPQANVEINRDKASALRVSAEQIESALSISYASQQISTI
jgi:HAE1 family hydrophobic/amphiphilic exporter-1